jgi:hypothetical protein
MLRHRPHASNVAAGSLLQNKNGSETLFFFFKCLHLLKINELKGSINGLTNTVELGFGDSGAQRGHGFDGVDSHRVLHDLCYCTGGSSLGYTNVHIVRVSDEETVVVPRDHWKIGDERTGGVNILRVTSCRVGQKVCLLIPRESVFSDKFTYPAETFFQRVLLTEHSPKLQLFCLDTLRFRFLLKNSKV